MSCVFRGIFLSVALLLSAATAFAQPAPEAPQPNPLHEAANQAYQERDFPKAIQACEQVLAKDPNDHIGLYLRGSSRVELGIMSGNVELVRQGIADAREAIRHEGKGKAEYYLPYIFGMSHLSMMEGKPVHAQTAKTVADSVLEREDLDAEQRANMFYQRAQANLQLKDFPAVQNDIIETLKLDPKHLAAYMLAADVAARTKTPEEAIAAYSKVVEVFPDNPVTYNNRGMFLQSKGRAHEALADFNKAIQIDSKFIPAYVNRGFAYMEAGDLTSADTALSQALAVDPQQFGAMNLRATVRLNAGRLQEAISDYRTVAQNASRNPMAHADLGFALFFAQDFAGALGSFNTALKIDNRMRFLLPWKLCAELRLQQVDNTSYQESTAKPEANQDWIDKLVLFQLGKLDAASMLQSVSSKDEGARNAQLCEGYYFIGMELQRRGRAADAQAYFKQATVNKLPKLSAYRGAMIATNQAK